MPITALPTPPSRSDPTNFATRADAFLGALPTFTTQANALEAENAAAATAAANAVLTSKVTGPASSTDNTLPRFDGATGKLIQGSLVVVDDAGQLGIGTSTNPLNHQVVNYKAGANANYVQVANGATGLGAANGLRVGVNAAGSGEILMASSTVATIDSSGNTVFNSGTFGYGAGAGGTVTQVTSKTTAVTLNKPNGVITTHNASMAIGAAAYFVLNNTFVAGLMDKFVITTGAFGPRYRVTPQGATSGQIGILIENISGVVQTDAIEIGFAVIKGSTT